MARHRRLDQPLVTALIGDHGIDATLHFAASVVPDSLSHPLAHHHRNNTVNSRRANSSFPLGKQPRLSKKG